LTYQLTETQPAHGFAARGLFRFRRKRCSSKGRSYRRNSPPPPAQDSTCMRIEGELLTIDLDDVFEN
jgi:hypothetical protein